MRPAHSGTEQVIRHVTAGSADIGFTEGPQRPAGLRSKAIGQDRLIVVVAPGHRWARRRVISAAELTRTPLVSREGASGTQNTLSAALTAALGADAGQVPPALSVSITMAVRAAVLAAAAPAVISELAVAEDLAAGRLIEIATPELDLRRALRAIWDSTPQPSAGAARDLISHILTRLAPPAARSSSSLRA